MQLRPRMRMSKAETSKPVDPAAGRDQERKIHADRSSATPRPLVQIPPPA